MKYHLALSDGPFREIKHHTIPRNLFIFNKRNVAVVLSPASEGLGAAVVAGVGSNLTQLSCISYFSIYTFFFWSTCIRNDAGPEFFVEICLNLKL